jgi:hypothetical protein
LSADAGSERRSGDRRHAELPAAKIIAVGRVAAILMTGLRRGLPSPDLIMSPRVSSSRAAVRALLGGTPARITRAIARQDPDIQNRQQAQGMQFGRDATPFIAG